MALLRPRRLLVEDHFPIAVATHPGRGREERSNFLSLLSWITTPAVLEAQNPNIVRYFMTNGVDLLEHSWRILIARFQTAIIDMVGLRRRDGAHSCERGRSGGAGGLSAFSENQRNK